MYVLSFRDLASGVGGAVTPAAIVNLGDIGPGFEWNKPKSILERLKNKPGEPHPAFYIHDWDEVTKALTDKRICFFVHGFNVNRDHGWAGGGVLGQQMLGAGPTLTGAVQAAGFDLVIPVLWPGDWYLPINYPFELGDVRKTAHYFADFLASIARSAASVSFASHSLGARVILETLTKFVQRGYTVPTFDAAIMAAAAANEDVLDDPNYSLGVQALRRIIVVSSMKDSVLANTFPAGNAVEAALWKNDKGSARALGRYGPKALKPDSPAKGKVSWFEVALTADCGHDGYLPWPWDKAEHPTKPGLLANGWTANRLNFEALLASASAGGPITPPATMIDKTFGV